MYTSHRSVLGAVRVSAAAVNSNVGLYTVYTLPIGLPEHLWRVFNIKNAMLLGGPNGVGWKEIKEAS